MMERVHSSPVHHEEPPDIDICEIVDKMNSLYDDRLRPDGRILLQRFNKQADVPILGEGAHDRLRLACEAAPSRVVVVRPTGADKDWHALLRGRPADFVDCMSLQDPYPPQFWCDFADYFEGQVDPLPAGRTACAEALMDRGLPFLRDLTLGDVCHIVQLALPDSRRILGRTMLRGKRRIVPYADSEDVGKVECARLRKPYRPRPGRDIVDDWPTMERCLQIVVADIPAHGMPVANIKHEFRDRFSKDLHETRLGYPTLVKLLLDPWLRHLCSVDLRGDKFVVVPLDAAALRPADGAGVRYPALVNRILVVGRDTFIDVVETGDGSGDEDPASREAASGLIIRRSRSSSALPQL